ncbi:MAG: hypothetical protein O7G87_03025, partial [bacterium]|nr:hypothetical protein [bacterium]
MKDSRSEPRPIVLNRCPDKFGSLVVSVLTVWRQPAECLLNIDSGKLLSFLQGPTGKQLRQH